MKNKSNKNISIKSFCTERLLSYLTVFFAGLSHWLVPIYDPDLGFHLLGGAWVYYSGDVPRYDFINAFNSSWIDYHWFGQYLIYLVYRYLGFSGLSSVCGIIGASLGVILLKIVFTSAKNVPTLLAVLYVLMLEYFYFNLISTRPTAIAVVLVATALYLLLKLRSKAFFLLFIISVVCANIHIYWVLIPFLWGTFFCFSRVLPCKQPRRFNLGGFYSWGGLFALIFSGLLSPYGLFTAEEGLNAKFANFYVFFDVAINPAWIKSFVTELRPGFSSWSSFHWFCLAACFLVVRGYSLSRIRVKLFELLLFCGSFVMLIQAVKYAVFFIIFSVPLVVPILVRVVNNIKWQILGSRFFWVVKSNILFKFNIPLYSIFILSLGYSIATCPFNVANAFNIEKELFEETPIRPCLRIPKIIPDLHRFVRVAAPYDYGGWCAWALNQEKFPSRFRLTFDGRTQFVPINRLIDGFNLFSLYGSWRDTLKRDDPDAIVLGYGHPLGQVLFLLKNDWSLAYKDESYWLFVRKR